MHSNRHLIIGTAGHVDHGKTELVKALTGVNTDRLKEEQERGISIELGFAAFELPNGDRVGLVDVPGHERFVKAMLAGAAGVDLGLLVIAADESVMPQTREHLDILSLLDVKAGIIVITKSDLADDDTLDLVESEVEDLVAGTFLENAARVRVSARTGAGMDDLRGAIAAATSTVAPRPSEGAFRLPVDRVFSLAGVGLTVTGTAWSGQVHEGDTVVVLPRELEARVRSVQVHGEKQPTARAGERVALNLHGLRTGDVERGMWVATTGVLRPTTLLDVSLRLLPTWDRPLAHRSRVRVHHGAAELLARVALLDRDELAPGGSAPVQLLLESPLAAERGDRIVVRSYSPMHTLGGGLVLDPNPAKHRRHREEVLQALAVQESGSPLERVHDMIRRAGIQGMDPAELRTARAVAESQLEEALTALERTQRTVRIGAVHYDAEAFARAAESVRSLAAAHQRANPLAWGIGRAELQEKLGHRGSKARFTELLEKLAALEGGEPLHLRPDTVRVGSADRDLAPADRAALDRLAELLRASGAAPPLASELQEKLGVGVRFAAFAGMLEERGGLVRVNETLFYDRAAFDDLETKLRAHLSNRDLMSMADFKELTGLSRKYAVPLLEYFDRKGVTARVGDQRAPGPVLRANR